MKARSYLAGGVVAGVLFNVTGIVLAHGLMREPFENLLVRIGGVTEAESLMHLSMRLGKGIAAFWILVATTRSTKRFGRSLGIATLVSWYLLYPGTLMLYAWFDAFNSRQLLIIGIWGVAECFVALAAGWKVAHFLERPRGGREA